MPSAAPLPTPAAVPTSTSTTNDPYGLPHPSDVFVEKKRRTVAPPPLQMPEAQTGTATNPSPVPGVSSPHYTPQHHPQMPQAYMGNMYHHSPMAVPQHVPSMPQYPHTPHMPPHMSGPMTPATPMVMTPMSGPHPGGFEGCPPPPPHAHHVPSGYHGMGLSSPMTPMTPMSLHTSMSFLSDSGSQSHVQPVMAPHPSTQGMYAMPPQQYQNMYEIADGHHSPTISHSPMAPSPMSGHSTPTYAPAYPNAYEMYPVQQMQPQYTNVSQVQQVPYVYEAYPVAEANVMPQMIDGEIYGDDASRDRRLRRPIRGKKEENQAVDAVRYKTKMCRNWELTNRCPYGPRCLFAHGRCELRNATANTEAICTAARSTSPKRAFYENGRFPEFIPIPTEMMTQLANERGPAFHHNAPSAIEMAGQMA